MEEKNLIQVVEEMGVAQPSLRAIAEALDVQQTRVYSVAKQPKAGEVYDAKVYNWDAITRFVTKRIGPDNENGLSTLEDVIIKALAIDAELSTRDHRRTGTTGGASKEMICVGEGKSIPKRRFEINVGDTVVIKKTDVVYTVVYANDVSVILQPVLPASLMLTSMSNWTLNQKMVAPVGVEKAAAEVKARLEAAAAATTAEAVAGPEDPETSAD